MRRKRAASFRRRMRDPSGSPSSCLFRESDKSRGVIQLVGKLAERVGFEPTLPVKVNTLSKRAPSATRPSLREQEEGAFAAPSNDCNCPVSKTANTQRSDYS